ncbi:hypothetical protein BL254_09820 [Protofrankia sp. BMG5.30]|uniref:Ferredoxin n=1 Tax=Protofrankia coriariae TaxID=1562887 RepID=A0ABR5F3Q1_9ACTN|nr:hypothetical protein FrCorBMG51_12870 [Protofrankia coriariae]ONH35944.1 hypothetical protein BL254_09820 [Protofrankia sp. BMG5.30]
MGSSCLLHACYLLALPAVFDLADDADQVTLLYSRPDDGLRSSVQRATSMCPMSAIVIEE